jgi:hypothetical protein
MRPGPEVLASFGASAGPVSLPGGEGTAWRAGEVVLKPAGPTGPSSATSPISRNWTSSWPAHVGRLVTEIVSRRGDPDPSAGLETVARTGEPVTSLILSRLA